MSWERLAGSEPHGGDLEGAMVPLLPALCRDDVTRLHKSSRQYTSSLFLTPPHLKLIAKGLILNQDVMWIPKFSGE